MGQSGIWYNYCALIRTIGCYWLPPTQHGHTDYNNLRDHLRTDDLLDLFKKFSKVKQFMQENVEIVCM